MPKYRTSSSVTAVEDSVSTSSKKEKRGAFGFHAHGHNYAPHYEGNHHHEHHRPPLPPHHPPSTHPVHLGDHFHTTVTKKIGIPIPYPYPVKVCKNIQLFFFLRMCVLVFKNIEKICFIFMEVMITISKKCLRQNRGSCLNRDENADYLTHENFIYTSQLHEFKTKNMRTSAELIMWE